MSVNQPTPAGSRVNKQVADAWSAKVGRYINFELLEVEAADGRKQTQLINPEEGSVVVAVNATGDDAIKTLVREAGSTFIDGAFGQDELDGPGEVNEVTNDPEGRTDGRAPHSSTQGVNPTEEVTVKKEGKVEPQSQPFGNTNREQLEAAEKDAPTTEGDRAKEEGIQNVVDREHEKKTGQPANSNKTTKTNKTAKSKE